MYLYLKHRSHTVLGIIINSTNWEITETFVRIEFTNLNLKIQIVTTSRSFRIHLCYVNSVV